MKWTETQEELVLVPPLVAGDTLSSLELSFVTRRTPDTLRMVSGYSDADGLYDEIHRLNPVPIERERWQDPLPAYHRMDAYGSTVKDGRGAVVLRQPPSPHEREEYAQLVALAESGTLTPFLREIVPSLAGRQALGEQGYTIEVRESPLTGRTGEGGFWGEGISPGDRIEGDDDRVLYAETFNEKIVADARDRSITTYTYADSANTVATAVEVRFLEPAERLGGEGFYETLIIGAREEVLPTGRPVQRTTITRRSGQAYTADGAEPGTLTGGGERFGTLANPLRAGQVLVAIPASYRGDFRLTLADVTGRLHVQRSIEELQTGLLPLELPTGLAAGAYVLSIHSDGGTLSQQLIVE